MSDGRTVIMDAAGLGAAIDGLAEQILENVRQEIATQTAAPAIDPGELERRLKKARAEQRNSGSSPPPARPTTAPM